MSQSSVIAGSLIVAFIVFITLRGELPCYLKVLGISTGAQCNPGNTALGSIITGILTGAGAGAGAGTGTGTGSTPPSPPASGTNQTPESPVGTLTPCPNGGYTLTGIC